MIDLNAARENRARMLLNTYDRERAQGRDHAQARLSAAFVHGAPPHDIDALLQLRDRRRDPC